MSKINENRMQFDGLAGGAAGEQFMRAYQEILNNIQDKNTDPKKKRELVIKLVFEPDEKRGLAGVSIQCSSKLAPSIQAYTTIAIARDPKTGTVESAELDLQKSVSDAKLLADTPVVNSNFK